MNILYANLNQNKQRIYVISFSSGASLIYVLMKFVLDWTKAPCSLRRNLPKQFCLLTLFCIR